jgi:hypothetical protein
MLGATGVVGHQSLIDVGGGALTLVDALLGRGFHDLLVFDISKTRWRESHIRSWPVIAAGLRYGAAEEDQRDVSARRRRRGSVRSARVTGADRARHAGSAMPSSTCTDLWLGGVRLGGVRPVRAGAEAA